MDIQNIYLDINLDTYTFHRYLLFKFKQKLSKNPQQISEVWPNDFCSGIAPPILIHWDHTSACRLPGAASRGVHRFGSIGNKHDELTLSQPQFSHSYLWFWEGVSTARQKRLPEAETRHPSCQEQSWWSLWTNPFNAIGKHLIFL